MHAAAQTTDADLLAGYLQHGDERAFATLVDLHERMVIGTAWRRTGDAELARDIAQEVFATLARKAAWLTERRSIAGWLYTTTVHLASRARHSDTARRAREQQYSSSDHPESCEPLWTLLEEALRELPSSDREAVVLHFLEDHSYEEMARTLGLSEVAARKRVSRGLKNLGVHLRRRGIGTAATSVLTGAVAAQASLPASVSISTVLTLAAAEGGSSTVIAITTIMSHTSTKLAAAAALLLAAPIAWQSYANSERKAELTKLKAENAAILQLVPKQESNGPLQAQVNAMLVSLREAQDARQQAERALAVAQEHVDQLQHEVVVSFGKSETIARQVASKIVPLLKLESLKAELKKNPNDPRILEAATQSGQSMTELLGLATQIALLEDDPVQYARFNAVLYGEVLGLDENTRNQLQAVFQPAFEQLVRDGLTIHNRPSQQSDDWKRRRAGAEDALWKTVLPILPKAVLNHPMLSMADGGPPVLFTSEKAFGELFGGLTGSNPMSLRAKPAAPAPASKQP